MEKWKVQAVKRDGFNGVWRAGRHWPSAQAIEVEVLDAAANGEAEHDDPQIDVDDPKVPGGKRKALNPAILSRASFKKVLEDPRLSKFRVGDDTATQDAAALRVENDDLKAQLAAGAAEIRRLQEALATKFTATLPARSVEVGSLQAGASAEAESLAKAPPPAPAAPAPEPEAAQDDHNPNPKGHPHDDNNPNNPKTKARHR